MKSEPNEILLTENSVSVQKVRLNRPELLLAFNQPMVDACRSGFIAAYIADDELANFGQKFASDILRSQPDALFLSKRSFDAPFGNLIIRHINGA